MWGKTIWPSSVENSSHFFLLTRTVVCKLEWRALFREKWRFVPKWIRVKMFLHLKNWSARKGCHTKAPQNYSWRSERKKWDAQIWKRCLLIQSPWSRGMTHPGPARTCLDGDIVSIFDDSSAIRVFSRFRMSALSYKSCHFSAGS